MTKSAMSNRRVVFVTLFVVVGIPLAVWARTILHRMTQGDPAIQSDVQLEITSVVNARVSNNIWTAGDKIIMTQGLKWRVWQYNPGSGTWSYTGVGGDSGYNPSVEPVTEISASINLTIEENCGHVQVSYTSPFSVTNWDLDRKVGSSWYDWRTVTGGPGCEVYNGGGTFRGRLYMAGVGYGVWSEDSGQPLDTYPNEECDGDVD